MTAVALREAISGEARPWLNSCRPNSAHDRCGPGWDGASGVTARPVAEPPAHPPDLPGDLDDGESTRVVILQLSRQ